MCSRPQLYVCGELFSGSDEKDKEYVLNLAFNGLIREAMQAPHTNELARTVFMYARTEGWGGGAGAGRERGSASGSGCLGACVRVSVRAWDGT